MLEERVSIAEACRRTGLTRNKMKSLIAEFGLKITMKGKITLISVSAVKKALEQKSHQTTKDQPNYKDQLVDHLSKTVERLEKENDQLKQEQRISQQKVERLLLELHRINNDPTPKLAGEKPIKRQGASAYPEHSDDEISLEEMCQMLDEKRGISNEPESKPSLWRRFMRRESEL